MLGLSVPDRLQAPVPARTSSTEKVISAPGVTETLASILRGSSGQNCSPAGCTALGGQNLATGTEHVKDHSGDTALPATGTGQLVGATGHSHLGMSIATQDNIELEESSSSFAQNGSSSLAGTNADYLDPEAVNGIHQDDSLGLPASQEVVDSLRHNTEHSWSRGHTAESPSSRYQAPEKDNTLF